MSALASLERFGEDNAWVYLLTSHFNPKGCGRGPKVPSGREIVCHFSQGDAMVTKILDFMHKHPNLNVVKSFFVYLDRFFRN